MDAVIPEPEPRSRLGLAWSVTLTFFLLTLFAIGLNTVVALRVHSLLTVGEAGRAGRDAVQVAALMMQGPEEDLSMLVRDAGIRGAVTFDSHGTETRRVGDAPEDPDARDVAVLAALRTGRTSVDRIPNPAGGEPLVRVVAPVSSVAAPRGALVAWIDTPPLGGATRARSLSIGYAVLNALVVGSFGWYLMTRTIVRPVSRLSDATRAVTVGDLAVRVRVEGAGELASLARDFNRMTEALARKVGELEEVNRSLRSAREEVIQAEKLAGVGRLAAGVAHELGNPVAAVTGYTSMLLRGREKDESADTDVLRRIDREMKRVDRIIRDLLEYSRPRPETVEPLDVDAVAEAALAIVGGQRAFQSIEVVRSLGKPPKVAGDPHRLSQVLVNLLINAADAVEGAAKQRIEIRTFTSDFPEPAEPRRRSGEALPEGPAVAIEVSDTGKGLSAGDRERMFEPFYTTKGKGTGLGLAISRTIIEAMGGRILARGEAGAGATFTVLLPVPQAG